MHYRCTVWNLRKFSLTLFIQKFRESIVFTKEVTKELISRNIFSARENFTVWKFRKFSPTAKIFRQIDLQYNSLVQCSAVNLTEFLQNIVGENFSNFHSTYTVNFAL